MPRFEFSPTITLGVILQIATMIGAIIVAYAAFSSKDVQHDERISRNQAELTNLSSRVTANDDILRQEVQELSRSIRMLDEKITIYIIDDLKSKNVKPSTR